MSFQSDDQPLIESYLLGRLDERDRADVQRRLLEDEEFSDLVEETENDLIDAYLQGESSQAERDGLESRLGASAALREKVRFWQAFGRVTNGGLRPRRTRGAVRLLALAASVIFLLAVGVLLIPDNETTTRQTVLLTSSVLRGRNDLVQIAAPPGVTHLDLKLILADLDDYPRYQAALFSASGRHLRDEPDLEAVRVGEISAVSFTVEVRELVEDLYEIQLSGVAADSSKEVLGFYYFRPPLPRQ